jgi:hypothetical protein
MYETAPKAISRQINQGFVEKLYLDEDGTVARVDLTEPFAALLAIPEQRGPRTTQDTPEAAQTAPDGAGG